MENNKYNFFSFFSLSEGKATNFEINKSFLNGIQLSGITLIILACSAVIASIGLYENSSPVIIGAMLISPIMGPILAMGYTFVNLDQKNFRKAGGSLAIQSLLVVFMSTIFFAIIPSPIITSEILGRTSPELTTIFIAFAGGIAGAIGNTRDDKMIYVVSGAAIATALIPPLSTVGFGIATFNFQIFIGALLLFFINTFFIGFATTIVTAALRMPKHDFINEKHRRRSVITTIVIGISLTIPSLYISVQTYNYSRLEGAINSFVSEQIDSSDSIAVIDLNYNTETKIINIAVIGENITVDENKKLNEKLNETTLLENYTLNITQSVFNLDSSIFPKNVTLDENKNSENESEEKILTN